MTIARGRVHLVGDHVDTDAIMPGRYLSLHDPDEVAAHTFERVDAGFVQRVRPGDILVAGRNFGCGSSREQAPMALKALGLGCVVAESFARIFFRNAVNLGLPIVVCPIGGRVQNGDWITVDTDSGVIELSGGVQLRAAGFSGLAEEIMACGGLVEWVRAELARREEIRK